MSQCYSLMYDGLSSSQDEAYSSGHFKDVKGLIMGMLETYNYEEVTASHHITCYHTFPLLRHCTKQPIIFCSMMSVTRWYSYTPCHRGDCPRTLPTVPYVTDHHLPCLTPLVKATSWFSGRIDLLPSKMCVCVFA